MTYEKEFSDMLPKHVRVTDAVKDGAYVHLWLTPIQIELLGEFLTNPFGYNWETTAHFARVRAERIAMESVKQTAPAPVSENAPR